MRKRARVAGLRAQSALAMSHEVRLAPKGCAAGAAKGDPMKTTIWRWLMVAGLVMGPAVGVAAYDMAYGGCSCGDSCPMGGDCGADCHCAH